METGQYLDRTLAKYAGTFDIYRNYSINGKKYPAYGYFFSDSEKYVLSKKANMWTIHEYEHILFIEVKEITKDLLDELYGVMESYMEPVLVRKNNKYPEKDHMSSFLTAAIICEKHPSPEIEKLIRKFRFDKGYLFSFRGHSEGHIICADMETESVITNYEARKMKKFYKQTFDEVKSGKIGYAEAYETK